MSKVSLGFVLGVIVTGLVSLAVVGGPDPRPVHKVRSDAVPATEALPIPSEVNARAELVPAAALPESTSDPEPLTVDELTRLEHEARENWLQMREELSRAKERERSAPDSPIVLPPEFDWLSERDGSAPSWHRMIQEENADPIWSSQTEAQINSYMAQHPELVRKYGNPTITCRTSICEIAFVAYGVAAEPYDSLMVAGPGGGGTTSGHFFHQDNTNIFEQPWADQFALGSDDKPFLNYEVMHHDGVTTVVWHLVQKPDQADASR